jgi:hypothetical protein
MNRLGLIAWNAFKLRTDVELSTFAGFPFDIFGPSYLRALVDGRPNGPLLPGFIVADVHVGFEMHHKALPYFIRKIQGTEVGRNRPAIGILVADSFSEQALTLGRREGIIVATPEVLFGRDVAVALQQLVLTLTNVAVAATSNPDVVTNLFDRLGKIEGAAANLRGPLFELIVAHLVTTEGGSIYVGRRAFSSDRLAQADIDVLRRRQQDVGAYECKGRGPGHEENVESVREWVEQKVPIVRDWLLGLEDYASLPQSFHYWTTGRFFPGRHRILE